MGSLCFAFWVWVFFSFVEGIFWILCVCDGFERSRFVIELKNTKIKCFISQIFNTKGKWN